MERVTFLVERTGARISCLLNPEALEARRTAGVVRRRGAGGAVLGMPRADDPLVATGGGVTEYDLRLLFDVDVANEGRALRPPAAVPRIAPVEPELVIAPPPGAPAPETPGPIEPGPETPAPEPEAPVTEPPAPEPPSPSALSSTMPPDSGPEQPPPLPVPDPGPPPVIDVRSLTQPLWALAETGDASDGLVAPQRIRFIWGKSWNVPGVVIAVAERLERFDANGVPRRSWLSLRLRRVEERSESSTPPRTPTTPQFEIETGASPDDVDDEVITVAVDPDGYAVNRPDIISYQQYGDPSFGLVIAARNDLDDPLRLAEGTRLRIPRRVSLQVA